MENLWPIIDDIKSTEDVLPFFYLTIESLRRTYEGKIDGQICQIEYILKNMQSALSTINNISKIVNSQLLDNLYEEKKDIEKEREPVYIVNHNYKYEIFNDHLYYKLFTINIPEYYPLKMCISAGILEKDDKELVINDIDRLKEVFSQIVNSTKVRTIIMKMKS